MDMPNTTISVLNALLNQEGIAIAIFTKDSKRVRELIIDSVGFYSIASVRTTEPVTVICGNGTKILMYNPDSAYTAEYLKGRMFDCVIMDKCIIPKRDEEVLLTIIARNPNLCLVHGSLNG